MVDLPEPSDIEALVRRAGALPALSGEAGRLERLVADYARGHARQDRALVVGLVGATGAGKSTLVNALAGEDIAEEGVDRPTSRHAVVYAPEDALLDRLAGPGTRVARYRVQPGAAWSGQVFIDTPDINSVETAHREVARGLLEQADVALVVMHRGSVAEATQVEFLREFASRRRLLFVLNFADQLGEAAREELKGQIRRLAASRYGLGEGEAQVFAISALSAKQGRDVSGELGALLSALSAMAGRATAERVRRSNALAVLRELQERIGTAGRQLDEALVALRAELDSGLGAAEEELRSDYEQRLTWASNHLKTEIRRQAAAHFWGPAGWWLRLSVWGASGVATAALLARRSVPWGLAVGAASQLVERVQERTRGHAAHERVVEAASGEDTRVTRVARTALTATRAQAARAGLRPSVLAIPDPEALCAALLELRAQAWRQTESEAVGEAVARWWRWARVLLLPLANLPLLALFGHVAYLAVRGYLLGEYLGTAYYLNAGAVALVLTGLGGMLGSLTLAGTVRRVRWLGTRRFTEALEALRARLTEEVGAPLEDARRAATELSALLPSGRLEALPEGASTG